MLRTLGYIFISMLIFVVTIFITLWLMLVTGNMAKARGWWYEWTDYINITFNLTPYVKDN